MSEVDAWRSSADGDLCDCGHPDTDHATARFHPDGLARVGDADLLDSCHPCLICECSCWFPADDE